MPSDLKFAHRNKECSLLTLWVLLLLFRSNETTIHYTFTHMVCVIACSFHSIFFFLFLTLGIELGTLCMAKKKNPCYKISLSLLAQDIYLARFLIVLASDFLLPYMILQHAIDIVTITVTIRVTSVR